MIRLITFATDDFSISASRLKATALRYGVDEVTIYTPNDLDPFFHNNIVKPLMKETARGYGFWVWKPYIILDAINKCNEGDILVYSDAGAEFKDRIQHVINSMDENIFLCNNGWPNHNWCKRETAMAINPYLENNGSKAYLEHTQVQASFIMFRKCEETVKFIQTWYAWCCMPELIDNTPRGEQFPEFQESRHDQAILCALQIKHGYRKHWFPSSTGHHIPRGTDPYPEIILHHRKRNDQW